MPKADRASRRPPRRTLDPKPMTPDQTTDDVAHADRQPGDGRPRSDDDWRRRLTPEQYRVLREGDTGARSRARTTTRPRRASTAAPAAARRCSRAVPSSTPAAAGPALPRPSAGASICATTCRTRCGASRPSARRAAATSGTSSTTARATGAASATASTPPRSCSTATASAARRMSRVGAHREVVNLTPPNVVPASAGTQSDGREATAQTRRPQGSTGRPTESELGAALANSGLASPSLRGPASAGMTAGEEVPGAGCSRRHIPLSARRRGAVPVSVLRKYAVETQKSPAPLRQAQWCNG